MTSGSNPVTRQIASSSSEGSRSVESLYRDPSNITLEVEHEKEEVPSSSGNDPRLLTSRLYASFAEFASRAQERFHIVAPYVRTEALDVILRPINLVNVTLITTWKVDDLLQGASDLNLYPYLRSRGWDLCVHPSLHAKLLVADAHRAIITSANITKQGLGIAEPCNDECASRIDNFSFADRLWLSVLSKNSIRVNDEYFLALKRHVEQQCLPGVAAEEFDSTNFMQKQQFLLSSLPMSPSPARLLGNIDLLATDNEALTQPELFSTLHDMALFSLDSAAQHNQNEDRLRKEFFAQPFVSSFISAMAPRMYFGEAKTWLQAHCSDVPTPGRKDLTAYAQTLFKWFADFNREYRVERPHYSECLINGLENSVRQQRHR